MIGAFAGVVHHICGSCSACITPPKQLKLLISFKKWRGSCSACITFLLHNVFHKICTALSTVRGAGVLHQICSGASPVRRELFIKWWELFITRLRPKNDVGGSSSSHAGSSSSHPSSSTCTHWMRHSHASHAIAGGMPIEIAQQNLGHASLATTTIYVTTEKSSADEGCRGALAEVGGEGQ